MRPAAAGADVLRSQDLLRVLVELVGVSLVRERRLRCMPRRGVNPRVRRRGQLPRDPSLSEARAGTDRGRRRNVLHGVVPRRGAGGQSRIGAVDGIGALLFHAVLHRGVVLQVCRGRLGG